MTSPLITQIDADLDAFFDSTNGFAVDAIIGDERVWDNVGGLDIDQDADGVYVQFEGDAGKYITSADNPNDTIFSDGLDLQIKLKYPDWDLNTQEFLFAKGGLIGTRAYQFNLSVHLGPGVAQAGVVWSDGATALSMANPVAVDFPDDLAVWLRWRVDFDDGLGRRVSEQYYSLNDRASWVLNGGPTLTSTAVSGVFNSGEPLVLGRRFIDNALPATAKLYQLELFDGYDAIVARRVFFKPPIEAKAQASFDLKTTVPVIFTENALPPGASEEALAGARGKLSDLGGVAKAEGVTIGGATYICRGRRPHGDGSVTLLLDEA